MTVLNFNEMVTITVPAGLNGWVGRGAVTINGRKFTFPIGVPTQVPKPVEEHIVWLIEKAIKENRVPAPQTDCVDRVAREGIAALTEEIAIQAPTIIPIATGEVVAVSDSAKRPLAGLTLYGKTTQDGTPSPDAPVPLVSVGDSGEIVTAVNTRNVLALTGEKGYLSNGNGTVSASQLHAISHYVPYTSGNIHVVVPNFDIENQQAFGVRVGFYRKDKSWISNIFITKDKTPITPPVDTAFVRMSVVDEWETALYFEDINEYEPANAQTLLIDTPNGLPGIPVSSGGNYTDENGQQWICDEVDFGRGVYVENIYKFALTGNENYYKNASAPGDNYFSTINSNIAHAPSSSQIGTMLCSRLPVKNSDSMWNETTDGCSLAPSGDQLRLRITGCNTEALLKAKLAEWNAAGEPLVVYAKRSTPIETPLSDEELTAYRAMTSQYPNTTVYNDAGAGMAVDYIADTKTYIDRKIAAIAAATV